PAASSSSTSCERRVCREPGALVWASSSTRRSAGRRASAASRSNSCRVMPRYATARRGSTSNPSSSTAVSGRPCVSTMPTTTSTPSRRLARASSSMAYVFPTPGDAPKKILSRPRPARAVSSRTRASNASGSGRRSLIARLTYHAQRRDAVQGEVEPEHVYARLAEEAKLPSFDVAFDQGANRRTVRVPRPSDSLHLEQRARRLDVRIEPRAGRGDEVGGNPALHPVVQLHRA